MARVRREETRAPAMIPVIKDVDWVGGGMASRKKFVCKFNFLLLKKTDLDQEDFCCGNAKSNKHFFCLTVL